VRRRASYGGRFEIIAYRKIAHASGAGARIVADEGSIPASIAEAPPSVSPDAGGSKRRRGAAPAAVAPSRWVDDDTPVASWLHPTSAQHAKLEM